MVTAGLAASPRATPAIGRDAPPERVVSHGLSNPTLFFAPVILSTDNQTLTSSGSRHEAINLGGVLWHRC